MLCGHQRCGQAEKACMHPHLVPHCAFQAPSAIRRPRPARKGQLLQLGIRSLGPSRYQCKEEQLRRQKRGIRAANYRVDCDILDCDIGNLYPPMQETRLLYIRIPNNMLPAPRPQSLGTLHRRPQVPPAPGTLISRGIGDQGRRMANLRPASAT